MTNTINKLVFDFTCTSEMLARKAQKEIVNYVAPKLENLMDNYLENHADEGEIIEIKTLEIDLGDILMDDFSDVETLKRVIEEIGKKLSVKTKNQEQKSSSIRNSELEIIKSFLLIGDVPWWVDKTQIIDFDRILKHQFEQNVEGLMRFFESHQHNSFLKQRLVEYFSKSSLELLNEYVFFRENKADSKPRESDSLHEKENSFSEGLGYFFEGNPEVLKENDSQILEDFESEFSNTVKSELSAENHQEVLAEIEQLFPRKLPPQNEIFSIENDDTLQAKIEKIDEILHKNSNRIVQVENYELEYYFEQLYEKNYSLLVSILEKYSFLINQKKYLVEDIHDENYFINMLSKNLEFVESDILKLIDIIINHPFFLKYNLIEVITKINLENYIERFDYQEFKEKESVVAQWLKSLKTAIAENKKRLDFISRIHQNTLPSNDYFQDEIIAFEATIYHHEEAVEEQNFEEEAIEISEMEMLLSIFRKKEIKTVLERNLVKKLLQFIPNEVLPIIHFFTQMKAEELALFSATILPLNQPEKYDSEEVERIKNIFKNPEGERKIIIENAGICIVSAYLSMFWKNLGYTEDKEFKTVQDACNAVSLLQYMATGEKESSEYLWQFNKLLCGFDIDDFISVKHTISENDFVETDELLTAVISNWNALKNTSINGLRTSFFQRKGILTEKDNHWLLQIERKGFDLLLDSIPWGFSTIKMPWMKKYIQVEW